MVYSSCHNRLYKQIFKQNKFKTNIFCEIDVDGDIGEEEKDHDKLL